MKSFLSSYNNSPFCQLIFMSSQVLSSKPIFSPPLPRRRQLKLFLNHNLKHESDKVKNGRSFEPSNQFFSFRQQFDNVFERPIHLKSFIEGQGQNFVIESKQQNQENIEVKISNRLLIKNQSSFIKKTISYKKRLCELSTQISKKSKSNHDQITITRFYPQPQGKSSSEKNIRKRTTGSSCQRQFEMQKTTKMKTSIYTQNKKNIISKEAPLALRSSKVPTISQEQNSEILRSLKLPSIRSLSMKNNRSEKTINFSTFGRILSESEIQAWQFIVQNEESDFVRMATIEKTVPKLKLRSRKKDIRKQCPQ